MYLNEKKKKPGQVFQRLNIGILFVIVLEEQMIGSVMFKRLFIHWMISKLWTDGLKICPEWTRCYFPIVFLSLKYRSQKPSHDSALIWNVMIGREEDSRNQLQIATVKTLRQIQVERPLEIQIEVL